MVNRKFNESEKNLMAEEKNTFSVQFECIAIQDQKQHRKDKIISQYVYRLGQICERFQCVYQVIYFY